MHSSADLDFFGLGIDKLWLDQIFVYNLVRVKAGFLLEVL